VTGLLDPKDWNITVGSAQELSTKANEFLAAEFARSFSVDKSDGEFVNFAVALRNYLGHRSDGSRTALKSAVGSLSESANSIFQSAIGDVGTYLKRSDSTGVTRAVAFAQRLILVAEKL